MHPGRSEPLPPAPLAAVQVNFAQTGSAVLQVDVADVPKTEETQSEMVSL